MSSTFKVCSYNMGSSLEAYNHLKRNMGNSKNAEGTEYDNAQVKVEGFLNGKSRSEVFCLQNCNHRRRPLIGGLINDQFEIIRLNEDTFDNAIALKIERFKEIKNHSVSVETSGKKSEIAIATAIDKLTNERVTFVSCHAPENKADHDQYFTALFKKLSEIGNNSIQVIGGDFNIDFAKDPQLVQKFSSHNFTCVRTNKATTLNCKSAKEVDKPENKTETDAFFAKQTLSLWKKIKSIFFSVVGFNIEIKKQELMYFSTYNNASNHLPIFAVVSYTQQLPKIAQLVNAILSTFGVQLTKV